MVPVPTAMLVGPARMGSGAGSGRPPPRDESAEVDLWGEPMEKTGGPAIEEVIRISGLLCLHTHGEEDDILFVSSESDPLADVLDEQIARKRVSVRYWIADSPCTFEEAQEEFVRRLCGEADTKFGARYSDITGYLWTDEKVRVGGHDLLAEFRSNVGKWLLLEVIVHTAVSPGASA